MNLPDQPDRRPHFLQSAGTSAGCPTFGTWDEAPRHRPRPAPWSSARRLAAKVSRFPDAEILEGELRQLLEPFEDATAEPSRAQRALVRDFLRDNQIPGRGDDLDGLDSYARHLEETLRLEENIHFSEYTDGFGRIVAETDVLLARAGHRLEASCLDAVLRRRITLDFFAGPGHEYLSGRLGLLMDQPGIEHKDGYLVLRAVVPGESHHEDPITGKPLCAEMRCREEHFRRMLEPVRTASCVRCRRLVEENPERVTGRVQEDVDIQLQRLSARAAASAATDLAARLRRDRRGLAPEAFDRLRRLVIWEGLVSLISEAASDQGLGAVDRHALADFWTPSRREAPRLPAGLIF